MNGKRPCVHLESENQVELLTKALSRSMDRFIGEGVMGVILDGGLSRGYGDHLSEIDVVVYLDKSHYEQYQNGICPFPLGIAMIDGYLYDIKIMDLQAEMERDYDSVALWDLSYAKVLYDPENEVKTLIQKKLENPVRIADAGSLMWEAWWHYKLAGDIWIHRRDILQGHYILNLAIRPLLGALFIVNQEYIPHDKWLIHMSRSLPWIPEHFEARLTGAICTGDLSLQSLEDRQRYIDRIWVSIDKKLCDSTHFHTGLSFTQKAYYDQLLQLTSKDRYTVEEWNTLSKLSVLNYEPIRSVFKKIDDQILFDRERLLTLCPTDMYSWMYQIACAVKQQMKPKEL